MNITPAENLFSSRVNPSDIDELSIPAAKQLFEQYKNEGVIKNTCAFADSWWQTTDEYSNVGLRFNISPFTYRRYENIFNMSLSTFTEYVKAYCLSIFGKNILLSINVTILDIKHLLEHDPEEVCGEYADLRLYSPNRLSDFLSIFITDDNI